MSVFHFVHPGDLASRTGGYRYARRLLQALAGRGVTAVVHRLADNFPFPDEAALAHAGQVLAAIPDGSAVVVDGLAFGAMPVQVAAHAARLQMIALVHHPLALETGLAQIEAARLAASEKDALACARAVVVTSPATAAAIAQYGVPAARITVAPPGTDRPPAERRNAVGRPAAGCGPSPAVRLLCVATITPRKGHLALVEALAACRARAPDLSWRLVCIGSLIRDPECAAELQSRIRALGLGGLIVLAGERDEEGVDRAYDEADIFVLASHHEGYGMVLAEAVAHGLPVISTTAGAIPQTVPQGAGVLVPPGDVDALASALRAVIADPEMREAMTVASRQAATSLPAWDDTADRFIAVLRSLPGDSQPVAGGALKFSASWLALREPHDHVSRAAGLTSRLCRFLQSSRPSSPGRPVRILDLACGSGSTLRYLAPRLGGIQHWVMVDRDRTLLELLPRAQHDETGTAGANDGPGGFEVTIEPICLDLTADLDQLPLQGVDLVTASALLDLVSPDWLDRLVAAASERPALLLALSYDGVMSWQPTLPDDSRVAAFFNRDQRSDKGFGAALGPAAADEAASRLRSAGYLVMQAPSAWRLGPEDRAIQMEFVNGVAGGAAAVAGTAAVDAAGLAWLQAWLDQRKAFIEAGRSAVQVGHQDLLALPRQSGR